MLKKILQNINFFVPKNKKQVCFLSPWENDGNAFLFYEFCKKHNPKNLKFIFLNDHDIVKIKFGNLKKIWKIMRSRVVITTHGPLSIKASNQILLSFFHGPLSKRGGLYLSSVKNQKSDILYMNTIDYQISTSKFISIMFSFSWCLHPKKYVYFGEPILEYLETIQKEKNEFYYKFSELRKKYKKIVHYAPTYRGGFYNNYTICDILDNFYNLVRNNPKLYFVLTLHPSDRRNIIDIPEFDNLEFLDGSANDILPFIDTLITDSSSIIYYGIYLNKEIFIYFPDYSKYTKGINLFWERLEIFPKSVIFKDENSENITNHLINYSEKSKEDIVFLRNILYEKNQYKDNKNIYDFIVDIVS